MALLCLLSCLIQPAAAVETAPAVSAEAAVLMDAESGRVLFEKHAHAPMYAASTAKILTALLVLEHCDPREEVCIDPSWTRAEGSSMYLKAGEILTVGELLTGLLLASGNDAALALACHVAGSETQFAELMNARAAELGMTDSFFSDASGLDCGTHHTSAYDMGLLACAAIRNPAFAALTAQKTAEVAGRALRNHNKLLWQYDGAIGIKTGYTRAAGRTLVGCAEREGLRLVCVTLRAPDDWADQTALFDWGFRSFEATDASKLRWTVPVVTGSALAVEASPAEAVSLLLRKGEALQWDVELPRFVYAPIRTGEVLGRLRVRSANGELLLEADLAARADVPLDAAAPLSFLEELRWCWYFACRHGYQNQMYPMYG